MKYLHILTACAAEPWALEKSKLLAIADFLVFKSKGGDIAPEEVARVTKKAEREVTKSEGAVAILPIRGVIAGKMNLMSEMSGGTSLEGITDAFRSLVNNDKVSAIILDIDSPGGVARGVSELASEISDSRGVKPIIAQVDMAASAAYWIASQADEIIVSPSGQGGSIGVYTVHDDISAALEKEGIRKTIVYSGKNKVQGNSLAPLDDDARAVLQESVDFLADMFTRGVAEGRKTTFKNVSENFGQGRMFNAKELVKLGMADRVGTMADTLSRFGIIQNPIAHKVRQPAATAAQVALVDDTIAKMNKIKEWGQKVNDDQVPAPAEFEAILRDAGVSKSQRVRIASRLHAVLRSESGENHEEVSTAIERLKKAANSFTST